MLSLATRRTAACGHYLLMPHSVNGMSTDPLGRGRPHKGPRAQRTVRVADHVNDMIERDATAQGLTMSDFLANIVHAHYGLPPIAQPVSTLYEPEELALKRAS